MTFDEWWWDCSKAIASGDLTEKDIARGAWQAAQKAAYEDAAKVCETFIKERNFADCAEAIRRRGEGK